MENTTQGEKACVCEAAVAISNVFLLLLKTCAVFHGKVPRFLMGSSEERMIWSKWGKQRYLLSPQRGLWV